jgi:uncharacterized protein (DUF2141 family)
MNRDLPPVMPEHLTRVFAALLAGAALAVPQGVGAQPKFTNLIPNDMSRCAAGAGPAVRIDVSGLKSADGLLIVRAYRANEADWLKGKKYFAKIHEPARAGAMSICVPVPRAGADYAIVVQHDVNGDYATSFSVDGAGMSNNPVIKTFLGIPRPPAVEAAAFPVGSGVTRIAIAMRYRN